MCVCVCVCIKMCAHVCVCVTVCVCVCMSAVDLNAVKLSSHGFIHCISEEKAGFPSYINSIVY